MYSDLLMKNWVALLKFVIHIGVSGDLREHFYADSLSQTTSTKGIDVVIENLIFINVNIYEIYYHPPHINNSSYNVIIIALHQIRN